MVEMTKLLITGALESRALAYLQEALLIHLSHPASAFFHAK
jgi:hypothetical protein